ncbi:hypothetical protein PR048_000152 [Dryococelus australis]|uniref:C2H2-type domain-containing protein n=1 Tax=Dryococelus australis TaxID=614101 RepID=A0ABQ9IDU3_9NEOP|nr:hypothetical protein PR048_000152 [Dryococelus australis]
MVFAGAAMQAQLRKYACSWCMRRYKQASSLGRHMRYECENAGKKKEQVCHVCGKRYFRPDTLTEHIQACHFQFLYNTTQASC